MSYDYGERITAVRNYIDSQCTVPDKDYASSYKLGYCMSLLTFYLSDEDVELLIAGTVRSKEKETVE